MSVPGIGLIGCGYWGDKLLRNLAQSPKIRLDAVSDLDEQQLHSALAPYPGVAGFTDYREMLQRPSLDAVLVATPAGTHYPIAHEILSSGRSVLVEKPLATSSKHALELVELAESKGLALMTGHTFLYSGAVERLTRLVVDGELGLLQSYDATRVNLGLFQPDVNVLWDLAVHDLAILDALIAECPTAVSATGASHIDGKPTSSAHATFFYPSSLVAHFHVSWMAPLKKRQATITGSERMVVYDDMSEDEKIRVFDMGVDVTEHEGQPQLDYRTNGVEIPTVSRTEPLRAEVEHFADCVTTGTRPRSDGYSGLRVVMMLEAACRSLEQQGRLVELPELPLVPGRNRSEPIAPAQRISTDPKRASGLDSGLVSVQLTSAENG